MKMQKHLGKCEHIPIYSRTLRILIKVDKTVFKRETVFGLTPEVGGHAGVFWSRGWETAAVTEGTTIRGRSTTAGTLSQVSCPCGFFIFTSGN